jgi:hypothetical protein
MVIMNTVATILSLLRTPLGWLLKLFAPGTAADPARIIIVENRGILIIQQLTPAD